MTSPFGKALLFLSFDAACALSQPSKSGSPPSSYGVAGFNDCGADAAACDVGSAPQASATEVSLSSMSPHPSPKSSSSTSRAAEGVMLRRLEDARGTAGAHGPQCHPPGTRCRKLHDPAHRLPDRRLAVAVLERHDPGGGRDTPQRRGLLHPGRPASGGRRGARRRQLPSPGAPLLR